MSLVFAAAGSSIIWPPNAVEQKGAKEVAEASNQAALVSAKTSAQVQHATSLNLISLKLQGLLGRALSFSGIEQGMLSAMVAFVT